MFFNVNKKRLAVFLSVAASLLAINVASADVPTVMVNGEARPAYKAGEVIVKYREGAARDIRSMETLYERLSVIGVERFSSKFKGLEQLTFNAENLTVEQAIAELQRDPNVEYAQPNYMLYASPIKEEAVHVKGEPCLIPGLPFPPGCDDSGGGTPPPGGGGEPCLIPGIPFPPGCDDSGGGAPPGGGNPPPGGGKDPAVEPAPAEVNPPAADPDLASAWGIQKVSADKAWAKARGSKDIIVAVIDTGVDYNHPDLAFNMWRNPNAKQIAATGIDPSGSDVTGDVVGYDFANNDALPFDDNMHGTHCAGAIGAVGGDGKGISGVSQRVSIMAVKFLTGQGSGTTADAIKGIDYAVSRGAKILSNSWGGPGDSGNNALKDAIVRAEKAGVLFVAAAGNDSSDNDRKPTYPAAFDVPNMVTVAATSETDGMAFFSNYGAKSVHIGAPGTNIYSTVPGGKYSKLSGTSMACPHVAGAAALLWAHYPKATYKEIKERLVRFGDPLSVLKGKTISGNRLNVLNSLEGTL